MSFSKAGGSTAKKKGGAKPSLVPKAALVAVPFPNAPDQPKIIKAKSPDDLLKEGVTFNVRLSSLDGKISKVPIKIGSMDDFETVVEEVDILHEQQLQRDFLEEFHFQINHSSDFIDRMAELLANKKRKEQLLNFLKGWQKELEQPDYDFFKLLNQSNL